MAIAHLGLGILIIGMTATATGQIERILVMKAGDTASLGSLAVRFDGVTEIPGADYQARRGNFTILDDGKPVGSIYSEKRFYPVEGMPVTKPGIRTTAAGDVYAVLGEPEKTGGYTVRLYRNPLVVWMWGGAIIMAFAGLLSLTDRRFRVGAPRPARSRVEGALAKA